MPAQVNLNSTVELPNRGQIQAVTFGQGLRLAYRPRPALRLVPGFSGAWAVRLGDFLALAGEAPCPSGISPVFCFCHLAAEPPTTNTTRKPLLLLRLPGVLLLRFDDSRLSGLSLFHDPPRNTRFGRTSHFQHSRPSATRLKSAKKCNYPSSIAQ